MMLQAIAGCAFIAWALLEAAKRSGRIGRRVFTVLAAAMFMLGSIFSLFGILEDWVGA